MAPHDDVDHIWQVNVERRKQVSLTNGSLDKNLRLVLSSLAEAYGNASHWTVRRQILSIMAKDVDIGLIRMFIPDLTKYRYYMARDHAEFDGKGVVVDDTRAPTIRYNDYQLEHFIEFIVSPHICTDLPFGEKELHLSTGEVLLIPLTIRNLAPQRIINQYYKYCEEYYGNTFRPLGQSTLFSILNECTASMRRSLQGLDSFSSEGSTAFDLLISIVEGLSTSGLTASDMAELKRDLQSSRNYLKTDYKVHVACDSTVADHCSTFALSDPGDKCWQQTCNHNHDQECDRCELLKSTLAKIRVFIEQHQTDVGLRDRLLHRVQQQVQSIEEWKAQLLRTIHQDQARTAVLNNLDGETVMIHVDWAMKWIPVKYRESTKDHFAKRGLSWHIAYVIQKTYSTSSSSPNSSLDSEEISVNDNLHDSAFQHKVFCHIFDQCVQNAKTVISILRHIFSQLRQTTPEIKYVHLRSDNAGCYHSGETLLSVEQLFKETGIWIKSIDFCDPQSGKSACDRMAAVIKCSVCRFINEKNNCTNAIEFLKAAETTKGVEFYASEIQKPNKEKIEWKGVKQINNIEYTQVQIRQSKTTSTQVRVWQSWQVGSGKVYEWSDFERTVQTISPLNVFHSASASVNWISDHIEKADKNHLHASHSSDDSSVNSDSSSEEEENKDRKISKNPMGNDIRSFDCQFAGCIARFRYHSNLLRHYMIGRHKMKLEKHTLIDKSKFLFHQSLVTNHLRSTPLLSITVVPSTHNSLIPSLPPNWASQKSKQNVRFNDKQKKFLQDKFNEGVQTGMKWDPMKVASDMEMLTNNGNYVFNTDECLIQGQIKSYFSRLAVKQKPGQQVIGHKAKPTKSSSSTRAKRMTDKDDTQSSDTIAMDESSDSEEIDDRDLEAYTSRQIFDEVRSLDPSSMSTTQSSSTSSSLTMSDTSSYTNTRSKKKSKSSTP